MREKRNAFYWFALIVYMAAVLYAIVCTVQSLGEGQEYPYLLKGVFVLLFVGLGTAAILFATLWARLDVSRHIAAHPRAARWAEWSCAALVLTGALCLRIWYLNTMPMQPESDFKTYYQVAQMLAEGTLIKSGVGYCDYVAMFPHVLGYPVVLSLVFRIFGVSVLTALCFNAVLSVATAFVIWRIARRLAGRIGGFFSLCAAAFWPSQVLFSNFVAGEFLFTFLLMCCVWIFLVHLQDYGERVRHPWVGVTLLAALGLLLAVTGTVRPMAILLLLSILICMLPCKTALPARLLNDIPLAQRLLSRGWKRCLVVLAVYLLCSKFFTLCVGYTVDRTLASGSASFGYNLLVGLNTESYGGWNQEDADLLYDSYNSTGSATEAHLSCRDLALQRLQTDPRALLNLAMHKFEVLWGNDDYGASWNILFMDQQDTLTPERESFYYGMMELSDFFYLGMLVMAGLAGIFFWKKCPDGAYVLLLLFLGTVAMHLLVENQNRYHFHALAVLAVFGGIAVSCILRECRARVCVGEAERAEEQEKKARRAEHVALLEAEEARLAEVRSQAMHSQFDLAKALREGHVNITVSEAVRGETAPPAPAAPAPHAPEPSEQPESEYARLRRAKSTQPPSPAKTAAREAPTEDKPR